MPLQTREQQARLREEYEKMEAKLRAMEGRILSSSQSSSPQPGQTPVSGSMASSDEDAPQHGSRQQQQHAAGGELSHVANQKDAVVLKVGSNSNGNGK